MDLHEAIRARKSVRTFKPDALDQSTIARLLDVARLAPSARNLQEWRFVVVTDRESIKRLADDAAGQPFIAGAPAIIVCCAATDRALMRCGHARFIVDVATSIDHLMLAATAEGLGSCWVGGFSGEVTRSILGIPPEIEVVALLPIGYPHDPAPVPKDRLSLSEIVHYERW